MIKKTAIPRKGISLQRFPRLIALSGGVFFRGGRSDVFPVVPSHVRSAGPEEDKKIQVKQGKLVK